MTKGVYDSAGSVVPARSASASRSCFACPSLGKVLALARALLTRRGAETSAWRSLPAPLHRPGHEGGPGLRATTGSPKQGKDTHGTQCDGPGLGHGNDLAPDFPAREGGGMDVHIGGAGLHPALLLGGEDGGRAAEESRAGAVGGIGKPREHAGVEPREGGCTAVDVSGREGPGESRVRDVVRN